MFSNRLAFVALGIACVATAAGGGYLAGRQDVVPAPVAATTSTTTPTSSPGATTLSRSVQETEALVGGTASKAPATLEATTPPVPSARRLPIASHGGQASAVQSTKKASSTISRQDAALPLERTSSSGAPGAAAALGTPSAAASQSAASTAAPPPALAPPAPEAGTGTAHPDDLAAQEAPRAPDPPQKAFEELVVSANSVIGLQTDNRISSETARVEDRVEARVTRDVRVADRVAIPAGSRAIGSLTLVEHGGKFKERARLAIRFHTLVLADGTRLPMITETIYRDGEAPGNSSAAKIGGGAVGGAILGAILGGAKGAAIGATAGAGGGAAVVAAGDRAAVTLPAGTPMTVRILSPVSVIIEK